MAMKAYCKLSESNLRHNLDVIRAKAPEANIMAIVKDDAYGHGLIQFSQKLDGLVEALGVASIDEAMALRKIGIEAQIVLIDGVSTTEELYIASREEFIVVFDSSYQIQLLKQIKIPKLLKVWMKLDSGMGWRGFYPDKGAEQFLQFLSNHPSVIKPVGIMSHFACADTPDHALNRIQISTFRNFVQNCHGEKSICNSAAIIAFPKMHYDWVRPGIALYGGSPIAGRSAKSLNLLPVMTFLSKLIDIEKYENGDNVGYQACFTCPEDMPVGFAAVGYGNGYPRRQINGKVQINGKHCPLIQVGMNTIAIDLRPCTNAKIGDEITLWGQGLAIEEVARVSGRLTYELMTNLHNVSFEWDKDDP